MLCSSAGPWKLVRGPHWSQMQLQVLGLIRPLTTHNSHRIDPISMPSPLADFMSCLKQVNPLSIHVALVSDNARIPSHGVMAHNGYREPSWPSRWASEKMTQISSQAPTRQISPQEGSLPAKLHIYKVFLHPSILFGKAPRSAKRHFHHQKQAETWDFPKRTPCHRSLSTEGWSLHSLTLKTRLKPKGLRFALRIVEQELYASLHFILFH